MNLGRGNQVYRPGTIYGTVQDMDCGKAFVIWYQHHASTWHKYDELEGTGKPRAEVDANPVSEMAEVALFGLGAVALVGGIAWIMTRKPATA